MPLPGRKNLPLSVLFLSSLFPGDLGGHFVADGGMASKMWRKIASRKSLHITIASCN